jgi:hypothetical protein
MGAEPKGKGKIKPLCELLSMLLPRAPMNKGKKGRSAVIKPQFFFSIKSTA